MKHAKIHFFKGKTENGIDKVPMYIKIKTRKNKRKTGKQGPFLA